MDFDPNGKHLVYIGGLSLYLLDRTSVENEVERFGNVNCWKFVFNESGTLLATAAGIGSIKVWTFPCAQLVQIVGENVFVRSICFNIDGTELQCAFDDGEYTLLKLTNIPPGQSQESEVSWILFCLVAVSFNGDYVALLRTQGLAKDSVAEILHFNDNGWSDKSIFPFRGVSLGQVVFMTFLETARGPSLLVLNISGRLFYCKPPYGSPDCVSETYLSLPSEELRIMTSSICSEARRIYVITSKLHFNIWEFKFSSDFAGLTVELKETHLLSSQILVSDKIPKSAKIEEHIELFYFLVAPEDSNRWRAVDFYRLKKYGEIILWHLSERNRTKVICITPDPDQKIVRKYFVDPFSETVFVSSTLRTDSIGSSFAVVTKLKVEAWSTVTGRSCGEMTLNQDFHTIFDLNYHAGLDWLIITDYLGRISVHDWKKKTELFHTQIWYEIKHQLIVLEKE
jgi:hypothetical protein